MTRRRPNRAPIAELPESGLAHVARGTYDTLKPSLGFIRGVLHDSSVAIVYGPPQSGKTFLALHMLCCAATETAFFGVKPKPRKGLYVALEGEANIKVRIQAWCKANDKKSNPIDYALGRFNLASDPDDQEGDVAKLINHMIEREIKFVVIDTLSLAMAGLDEIAGQQMTVVIEAMHQIKRATGACVVAVGHTGKNEKAGIRGHSSQVGNVDTTIEVVCHNKRQVQDHPGAKVRIEEDDISLSTERSFVVRKQRDGAAGHRETFDLKLKTTEFLDLEGNTLQAPAVHECELFKDDDEPAESKAPKLSKKDREANDVLTTLIARHERFGLGAPTRDHLQRVLRRAKWRNKDKPATWRQAFKRFADKLTMDANEGIEHAL